MLRIDASQLKSPERTDEGYVRAEGIIAVPGPLKYRTKGGDRVTEYVPEETLKDEDFLASLEGKPVTLEHPPPDEPVGPDNYRKHSVGHVQNVEWVDGSEAEGVKGEVLLKDQQAITAFESGTDQLSPRYEAEVAEYDGPEYDFVQTKRRAGNHVALTTSARAGSKTRLRADSDAVQIREDGPVETNWTLHDALRLAADLVTDEDVTLEDLMELVAAQTGLTKSDALHMYQGDFEPTDEFLTAFADVVDVERGLFARAKVAGAKQDSQQPQGVAMPDANERVRLDSERTVTVDEQTAQTLRTWKQDMEEEELELSSEIESAQEQIDQFKSTISELEEQRDELSKQIEAKRKQLKRLADKMGLTEMMGSESDAPAPAGDEESGESGPAQDMAEMPKEDKLDSLVAQTIDRRCRERMDALEAAEMVGLEVDEETPTTDVKADVVEKYFDDRSPDRADSAQVDAYFQAAVDMLEERTGQRDESMRSASQRADSKGGEKSARQQYRETVFS